MKKILLDFLRNIAPIQTDEEKIILNVFKETHYKAKEYLLKAGEVCQKLYFINEGLVRVSLLGINSEDTTFNFRDKYQFATDYESFLTQKPASFSLQALENTNCFEVEKTAFDNMRQSVASGEFITRTMADGLYLEFKARLLSFYQETPEERYLKLFETNPTLINRVPQGYLASYIGVRSQSLSRIKRRYMEAQKKAKS